MSVFTNPASQSREQATQYTAAVLKLLEHRDPLTVLAATADRLRFVVAGMEARAIRTPESPGKWSVTQVLAHLADSEVVWAWRLRLILAQDRPAITGYDQDAWAENLHYEKADPAECADRFAILRDSHLLMLRHLTPEQKQRVGVHAERGEESVDHLIKLYAGHDILHLNQIERIRKAVRG
ncbi:MAG TPA: DinB family protein [Gemmatimonadaceae bacterium]|nr:DinB family protein [Gemmatimonadaceae bacterium]